MSSPTEIWHRNPDADMSADINDRNQVASIPRRLLDPRRPRGAPTSSDKEEMLVPYDPLIAPEIKRVVSHKYQVCQRLELYTDGY